MHEQMYREIDECNKKSQAFQEKQQERCNTSYFEKLPLENQQNDLAKAALKMDMLTFPLDKVLCFAFPLSGVQDPLHLKQRKPIARENGMRI